MLEVLKHSWRAAIRHTYLAFNLGSCFGHRSVVLPIKRYAICTKYTITCNDRHVEQHEEVYMMVSTRNNGCMAMVVGLVKWFSEVNNRSVGLKGR